MERAEQFEKLKKLLEDNNFELVAENSADNDTFFIVKERKDEWEEVEFAEYIDDYSAFGDFIVGRIYKRVKGKSIEDWEALFDEKYERNGWSGLNKQKFKPSTEQAYVDQLKAKAVELYGEIKEGDKFQL